MKTRLLSKLASKFLFLTLSFLIFWGRAKESRAAWNTPPQSGVPMPIEIAAANFIKTFIYSPLIVLGLVFYGLVFFYRLKKKDLKKSHKLFVRGTMIFVLALLFVYIAWYIKGGYEDEINPRWQSMYGFVFLMQK